MARNSTQRTMKEQMDKAFTAVRRLLSPHLALNAVLEIKSTPKSAEDWRGSPGAMDTILDCFFEKVFASLPRGALVSRYKREELTDYFGTVIVGCVGAEQVSTQEAVSRAVCAALRYHSATRDANGSVCLKGKFHDILYVVAKLSFDWELEDTNTARRLLLDIHRCEGTFERLVVGAIVGTRVSHVLSGWKSDFADREENVSAVQFFSGVADEGRLVFGKAERRFVDVPMATCGGLTPAAMALDVCKVDTLTMLLRHGATIHFPDRDNPGCARAGADEERATPFDVVFGKMLDWRERHPDGPLPGDLVACLRLLLRAFPSAADSALLAACPEAVLALSAGPALVPPSRLGFAPPELKHLSRCAVRRQLHAAWALPRGIDCLDVPQSLRLYLDLELD